MTQACKVTLADVIINILVPYITESYSIFAQRSAAGFSAQSDLRVNFIGCRPSSITVMPVA